LDGNLRNFLYQLLFSLPATLLAISVHESAHALVSYLCGDTQVKADGRISLNPFHHLDLVGTLCLIFFHFGWAKPVVVNTSGYKHKRLDFLLVALAGPVSNFLLAALSAFFECLVYYRMTPGIPKAILFQLLMCLTVIDIGLGVFNLIPIPPLDGSNALLCLLPRSAAGKISRYRRYSPLLLVILLIVLSYAGGDFLAAANAFLYNRLIGLFSGLFSTGALPAAV
jgi:Zn-dependent protease